MGVGDPIHSDPSNRGGGVHGSGEAVLIWQRRDSGALTYGTNCLQDCLGDPLFDVLLMMVS